MRYRVGRLEIRSENAAKPATLAGRWVLDWISGLPRKSSGLDIGCGKLRYTIPLAKRIKNVTAVDSSIQVERVQKLGGRMCSIRKYVEKSLPNVQIRTTNESNWRGVRYGIILCSNVLSAIPSKKHRKEIIKTAHRCLSPGGQFLLTTQFRNSYFTNWETDQKAKRYLDGYLIRGARGASFYGIIDETKLRSLCERGGFKILSSGHAKELAFVIATR